MKYPYCQFKNHEGDSRYQVKMFFGEDNKKTNQALKGIHEEKYL